MYFEGNHESGHIEQFIKDALHEDIRDGDHTSLACIDKNAIDRARLLVKDTGVIAGVEFAIKVFEMLDPTYKMDLFIQDGALIQPKDEVFHVTCHSQALLSAERLVLNMMQRMSGIATMSRTFADAVEGYDTKILDTRKTTPLLRYFEKWAVKIGGCENYRFGLYDWIMIKDNHVDACGSHEKAIKKVHAYFKEKGIQLGITVEVRNMEELDEVLQTGGVSQIMLDNFTPNNIKIAVDKINKQYKTEASGGITLDTIREYAATGVDYISVGALTHSYNSLDLSLKVMKA